jgi:hypothetical protein
MKRCFRIALVFSVLTASSLSLATPAICLKLMLPLLDQNYLDSLEESAVYSRDKVYKFVSRQGQIINGRFLGKRNLGSDNHQILYIEDEATQNVVSLYSTEIFDSIEIASTAVSTAIKAPPLRILRRREIPASRLDYPYKKNLIINIASNITQKMTEKHWFVLMRFLHMGTEHLERFDLGLRGLLSKQKVPSTLDLTIVERKNSEEPDIRIVSEEKGKYGIVVSVDFSLQFLGLDYRKLLNARAQIYSQNQYIKPRYRLELFDHPSFEKGFADYLVAHYSNEQLTVRPPREILSPLNFTRNGVLDSDALSVFYSYPMWIAHSVAGASSPPEIWSWFFNRMKAYEAPFNQLFEITEPQTKWSPTAEENEFKKICFFYSYLFYQARVNPMTPENLRKFYQEGYSAAKEAFLLPWEKIESVAERVN